MDNSETGELSPIRVAKKPNPFNRLNYQQTDNTSLPDEEEKSILITDQKKLQLINLIIHINPASDCLFCFQGY